MSLYFTKEHEWIRVEGDTATVGISQHAQHALGDIVQCPDAAVIDMVEGRDHAMGARLTRVGKSDRILRSEPAPAFEHDRASCYNVGQLIRIFAK